ncbi:MAG: YciI family protein [Myxococcales bacterium]
MQYLLLIYEGEKRFANLSKPDLMAEIGQYQSFGEEFASAIQGGNALQPTSTATTVRVREGKRLTTDGPFAETKEQLGGYYLVEARDLDAAIAIAAKIPGARYGSVEVRPIQSFD